MSTLIAQTGWSTYDSARGRCSLYWDEVTNQSSNVSVLNYSLVMDTEPTGYYRTLISGTLTIGGNTITLPSNKRFYNGNTIASGSLTIPHETNGEKTISVNVYVNIGGDIRTADATITLTKINRGNEFNVNPTYTIGANISIEVTKYISTYRSEIRYILNNVNYILVAKESDSSLDTSFTLLYSDVSSHMLEYTSATLVLLCYTYNDDLTELIDTKTFYITVSTGAIPISMYDDRAGNVGVTIGEQAAGPGFNVLADDIHLAPLDLVPNGSVAKMGYRIDGKDVYAKLIRFTDIVNSTAITSKSHGISSYTRIWIDNSRSYFYHATSKLTYTLNIVGYSGGYNDQLYAWIDGSNVKIKANTGWNNVWEKNIVIMYY